MKKQRILIMLLAAGFPLFFTTSCKEVTNAATVTVSYDLPRINFSYSKTNFKSGEVILYSGMVRINLDSLLNAHGLSSGVVGSTYLSQFSITVNEPPEATFNWLQSTRAEFAQDAGFQTALEVASAINSDTTSKVMILTTNNVNIRPYLGNTAFYMRVFATLNGPLPYDWVGMYINATLKFTLEPLN